MLAASGHSTLCLTSAIQRLCMVPSPLTRWRRSELRGLRRMGIPAGKNSGKNSTALRDLSFLVLVYAVWELAAWFIKKSLLRRHPKKKGVPLPSGQRPT
jgi:hypothetical protein